MIINVSSSNVVIASENSQITFPFVVVFRLNMKHRQDFTLSLLTSSQSYLQSNIHWLYIISHSSLTTPTGYN